jgi:hypothetical protein
VAKEIIWQFDQAQERRRLSHLEEACRVKVKDAYLGLLMLEKVRVKQRSRLTNIRHGNTNTKLIYMRANNRKRKRHIQILQTSQGLAISHEEKEEEIARHFGKLLGTKHSRSVSLNWEELDYPRFNLADLEANITKEEVTKAVANMPKENAPGPDGFIGAFYSKCWEILKSELFQAVCQLSHLRGSTFNLLNIANIVLLPKKDQTEKVGDFKPISLIYTVWQKSSLRF